jgi:hypothetical protein
VRFEGRFQLRLATNSDPFDEKWGTADSSFRLYAVQGPNLLDPAQPTDEPELDRIIRFHDVVALRPHCRLVEVTVEGIEAEVGGATVRFTAGDPLIDQPVRLGPACKIEEHDVFALTGRAPIGEFRLEIGALFSGASAPAAPPNQPPSNAPRANGIIDLTEGIPPYNPSDFGYLEDDWLKRADAVVAKKRADLEGEEPVGPAAERIRTRRLQEHMDSPCGVAGAMLFMQNYTGEMDRDLSFAPDPVGALAYLATLGEVQFSGDFLDFDSDCQCGSVIGTLGKKTPPPTFAAASLMPPGEGRELPPGLFDRKS